MADYPSTGISSTPSTHGVVVGEVQAVALMPPLIPPPASGRWFAYYGQGGATAHGEGQIVLTWFPIPFGQIISAVAAEVATTAGSTGSLWRFMLYKHNITTGLPDALLSDLGTVSGETLGVKSIATTGSPAPDNYGGIWVAYVNQGAATTRANARVTAAIHAPAVTYDSATSPGLSTITPGWATTATTHTGAAPANVGALAVSGNPPRFLVQYG